jgi:hypothetical protein
MGEVFGYKRNSLKHSKRELQTKEQKFFLYLNSTLYRGFNEKV